MKVYYGSRIPIVLREGGHMMRIAVGITADVPDVLVPAAKQFASAGVLVGALDGSQQPKRREKTLEDDQIALSDAVAEIIARNNDTDINSKTGLPTVAAVAKIIGRKPLAAEIKKAADTIKNGG